MSFKELIQKDIDKILETGFEDKKKAILMAGMLVARGEPYCTMVDLLLITNEVIDFLEELK